MRMPLGSNDSNEPDSLIVGNLNSRKLNPAVTEFTDVYLRMLGCSPVALDKGVGNSNLSWNLESVKQPLGVLSRLQDSAIRGIEA